MLRGAPVLLLLGLAAGCGGVRAQPAGVAGFAHDELRAALIAAFNRPALIPALEQWLEDDGAWCDPYPLCVPRRGGGVARLLGALSQARDAYLIPSDYAEGLIANGASGGFLAQSVAVTVGAGGCMAQSPQYVTWDFGDGGKVRELRWYYDADQWAAQLAACNATGGVAKGRPDGSPPPPGPPGARAALQKVYSDLLAAAAYDTADPRWVDARMEVFAREGNVTSCDPYPHCAAGAGAIAGALRGHGAGIYRTAQSLLTPVWVSGDFGAAMTTFTAVGRAAGGGPGCLASHVHMEVFRLSADDPGRVADTRIYYSDASMAPHNCSAAPAP